MPRVFAMTALAWLLISDAWLFYANTVRFASAMAEGVDYGAFADGCYQLKQTIMERHDRPENYRILERLAAKP